MRLPIIIAAFLAASPAEASSLQPPARFDHDYDGPTEIMRHPTANVARQCAEFFGWDMGASVKACGGAIDGTCYIIVATYAQVSDRQMLIRHERAHCNGWAADHPR